MTKADFAHIYEEFFPRLYSYIFHRVNDSIVAEDIVSQVFFKALRNLEKYDSEKWQISTWLYTIASNILIDHYRKDEQFETIEEYEDSIACEDETSTEMDFETDLTKVLSILHKLPGKTQEIITLRIFEELSFVEIAKIIGIGESWVKMWFARWIEIIKNSMNILIILISFFFN